MKNRLLNFLYRRTFLCCVLYKRTIAYRALFPKGCFLDPETPYKAEVALILKAIRCPSYSLEEMDMGIVLSQLIQSDIEYTDAYEICGILNEKYANELHYMNRRNIIEMQLEDFERKLSQDHGRFENDTKRERETPDGV